MSPVTDTRRLLEPPACWRGPNAIVNEWVRWCCLAVGRCLADLSARPTRLSPLGPGVDGGFGAVCTIEVLVHAAPTDEDSSAMRVVVGLDAGAAHAIVDAIVNQVCGFRSGGVLTDAYRTALEHVALEVVDHLTVAGGFAGTVRFGGCRWEPTISSSGGEIIRLHVGALGGLFQLTIDPGCKRCPQVLPASLSPDADDAPDFRVALALRAPRLRMPLADVEAMCPGDALFAGFTDALNAGSGFRLVTENGWDVAAAKVRHYSPTALEIACDSKSVVPDADDGDSDDMVTLRPLHGSVHMTQSDLRALMQPVATGASTTIRLETHPSASSPVRLFHRHRPVATAELVRLEGEAAYRLLAVDHSLLQR